MTTTLQMPPPVAVEIPAGLDSLTADVVVPDRATGVVLFGRGSGNGRHSERDQLVASELNGKGFATVRGSLLTFRENVVDEKTSGYRFDIGLLARRMIATIEWAVTHPALEGLPVGLFGARSGAAAALDAAASRPRTVRTVVSLGGRVDLATEAARVHSPTLLIVGGNDPNVLEKNKDVFSRLSCEKKLIVVPGAPDVFQEAGTLQKSAQLATEWFTQHLR